MADDLPELCVPDAAAWRAWLQHHLDQPTGVWLVLAKKGTTEPTSLRYDQALDEALCFGWIDGQVRGGGDGVYRQRWTPRRKRSPWSQRNVEHATRLISQGAMQPAGLREVERAKADGRWDAAYAGPATMTVPADLAAGLAQQPRAQAMFEILTSQNRYAILHRLGQAKKPDTRARRVQQYVDMLARGETIYPQTRRLPND
jgi:uncharacterized protein YdeI (YjbR/CyaY-like superfamily)